MRHEITSKCTPIAIAKSQLYALIIYCFLNKVTASIYYMYIYLPFTVNDIFDYYFFVVMTLKYLIHISLIARQVWQ